MSAPQTLPSASTASHARDAGRRREPRRDYPGATLLATHRLTLRGLRLSDVDDLSELHAHERVRALLLENVPIGFLETVGLIVRANHLYNDSPGLGIWHARDAAGAFVGLFSLVPVLGAERDIELGARLMPAAFGKLYSLEGARALRDHAFGALQLPRLRGFCHPDNHAVPAIFRRLGFSDAGPTEHLGREALSFQLERADWARRSHHSGAIRRDGRSEVA